MILDNQTMIAALDASDRTRYYHWCADLSLAGEDYKVNEIVCFVCDASDPLADFIQVKKYDVGFLLILVYTENQNLIAECMDYVDTVKDAFEEIELRTPHESVLQEPPTRAMGVTEIRLLTMGMPNSFSISSPVFTRSLAHRVILL